MKTIKLWILAAFILLGTVSVSAQKISGMRMEIAESETDNGSYTIFTYKDEDGISGYYMSVARTANFLGADEILGVNIQNVKEAVIWLGSTTDEAFATLDNIISLYDKDLETTEEFQGRVSTSGDRLGEPNTVKCMVVKKLLGGKRLQFIFTSGKRQAEAFLGKSTVKELRSNFKLDVKLHPKRYNKK